MPDTRMILVDGTRDATPLRLAQGLALQLEAHGREVHLPMRAEKGHPLRRAWSPESYASVEDFTEALVLQWQNFAIRAAAETTPWLCAGVWLEAPRRLQAAGLLDDASARALAVRLFDALEGLAPALLYLGTARGDAVGDGAFAALDAHRTLLNAERLDAGEQLAEALAFLAVPPRPITVRDELARRLAGRYGADPALELASTGDGLALRGLPADLGEAPRPLLPAPDGRFLVAGVDLELRADLDRDGRPTGLLARTTEPALADLPPFLARSPD